MAPAGENSNLFDVVILGGGPAGTAAGLTLLKREGVSVAILEKTDYSAPRMGESLSPGMRPLLEYLDVWERFNREQSMQCHGTRACWGSDKPRILDYLFTIHGAGWSLDRALFDRMLAEEFALRGGQLYQGAYFLDAKRSGDREWRLRVRMPEKNETMLQCRYLIDASGRKGQLARILGIHRASHDRLVGVANSAPMSADAESGEYGQHDTLLQVEACEYGWWYTAPVPGHRISVVLMTDCDIVRNLEMARPGNWWSMLQKTRLTSQRLAGVSFDDSPKVFPCDSSSLRQAGGTNWIAVGDAFAAHDPLSSSGIPHAIGSGVHGALVAASCLYSGNELARPYQEKIQRDFSSYLDTRWQYYRMEGRWSESPFWKRRTTSVQIDPEAIIQRVDEIDNSEHIQFTHLPHRYSRQLHNRCRPGRIVHQIVREFVDHNPSLPDQRVILQLQELVAGNHVVMCQ